MRRSTLALVLSLTAVFISGAIVGGFGYRTCTAGNETTVEAPRERQQRRPPSPEEYRRWFVDQMRKHVGLTDEQVAELHVILDRTHQRTRELDARMRPERIAIGQKQIEEINAILTDEQKVAYKKLLDERAERRRKARERSAARDRQDPGDKKGK